MYIEIAKNVYRNCHSQSKRMIEHLPSLEHLSAAYLSND